jgi:hypothetical protein
MSIIATALEHLSAGVTGDDLLRAVAMRVSGREIHRDPRGAAQVGVEGA